MDRISLLSNIFKYIIGKSINLNEKNQDSMAHRLVYLLHRLGLYVEDYRFLWLNNLTYSPLLAQDINKLKELSMEKDCINFNSRTSDLLHTLKNIIDEKPINTNYNTSEWIEAITNLHYIKSNIIYTENQNDILEKLKSISPHLNDDEVNQKALSIAKSIL